MTSPTLHGTTWRWAWYVRDRVFSCIQACIIACLMHWGVQRLCLRYLRENKQCRLSCRSVLLDDCEEPKPEHKVSYMLASYELEGVYNIDYSAGIFIYYEMIEFVAFVNNNRELNTGRITSGLCKTWVEWLCSHYNEYNAYISNGSAQLLLIIKERKISLQCTVLQLFYLRVHAPIALINNVGMLSVIALRCKTAR